MVRVVGVFRNRAAFPHRALINPRAHQADLLVRQRIFLLRHRHEVGMHVRQHLDQDARGAVAHDDGGTMVAALEDVCAIVCAKPRLLFLRAVAIVATLGEQRLQVLGEIHNARCRRGQGVAIRGCRPFICRERRTRDQRQDNGQNAFANHRRRTGCELFKLLHLELRLPFYPFRRPGSMREAKFTTLRPEMK